MPHHVLPGGDCHVQRERKLGGDGNDDRSGQQAKDGGVEFFAAPEEQTESDQQEAADDELADDLEFASDLCRE